MNIDAEEPASKISWREMMSPCAWRTCLFCLSCVPTAWRGTQHRPGACRKPGMTRGARVEPGLFKTPSTEQKNSGNIGSASHFLNLKLQTSAKFRLHQHRPPQAFPSLRPPAPPSKLLYRTLPQKWFPSGHDILK